MKMFIKSIHIFTLQGEEKVINFSKSLNFIYGNFGVGKSTMLDLIIYCFGGKLTYTPAINRCLEAVQTDVLLNNKLFRFFRMSKSNHIQVEDVAVKRRYSLLARTVSAFLFEQCSLPQLYLSKGNIEDRKVQLTFTNFCWFSYLKQQEMDNCFFNLDSANIYKQNAAINAIFSFFESDYILDEKESQRYRDLKRLIRQYEEGDKVFDYVENAFGKEVLEESEPQRVVLDIKKEIESILFSKNNFSKDELSSILDMHKKLCEFELKNSFDMRRKIYNQKLKELQKQIEGATKSVQYDQSKNNPNVQQLNEFFLDCLLNVGFPGVSKYDLVYLDSKNCMPILFNPYERRKLSYDNLGSGGKKTIFKICFALAIHRLQHTKEEYNYLPSFFIIDTPMKNISEREDRPSYQKFYKYLLQLFSTELSDTQLFVVEKEKIDFTDYKYKDDMVIIRMAWNGEGINSPLFSNYLENRTLENSVQNLNFINRD